jgi:tetratricopeptide (TPR) repeat protein
MKVAPNQQMIAAEAEYTASILRVTAALRSKRLKFALNLLVDIPRWKLKPKFQFDPNHSWYLAGDIYWQLGEIRHSILAFRLALRKWPEDSQALWAIANCYSGLRSFKLAERFYRRALHLDKSNDSIQYNLANSLFDQKRFRAAIVEYKKIKKTSTMVYFLAQKNTLIAKEKLKVK